MLSLKNILVFCLIHDAGIECLKVSRIVKFILKQTDLRARSRTRMKKKTRVRYIALALFFTLVFVPEAGIEPALPKEQDFESSASTSSATRALDCAFRSANIKNP